MFVASSRDGPAEGFPWAVPFPKQAKQMAREWVQRPTSSSGFRELSVNVSFVRFSFRTVGSRPVGLIILVE